MQILPIAHLLLTIILVVIVFLLYKRINNVISLIGESNHLYAASLEQDVPIEIQVDINKWLKLVMKYHDNPPKAMEVLESALERYEFLEL